MAGTLTVDTLNTSTGVLATQNGMSGIAKAWATFSGGSGTPVLAGSFNVSSVTYSTGVFTVNFTTAMPNANYSVVSSGKFDASYHGLVTVRTQTTGSVGVMCMTGSTIATYLSSAYYENVYELINVAVFA